MAEGPGDDCQLLAVLEHEGRVGMAQIVEPLKGEAGPRRHGGGRMTFHNPAHRAAFDRAVEQTVTIVERNGRR